MDALNIMPVSMKLLIGRFERIISAGPLKGGSEGGRLSLLLSSVLTGYGRCSCLEPATSRRTTLHPVLTLILRKTAARRGAFPDVLE